MGKLLYGNLKKHPIAIDDFVLAHLQLVAGSKLRRGEGFFLTILTGSQDGDGRITIWLASPIDLEFRYETSATIPIDREWLEKLSGEANSTQGLWIAPTESDRAQQSADLTRVP